jgi:hypothetical protein
MTTLHLGALVRAASDRIRDRFSPADFEPAIASELAALRERFGEAARQNDAKWSDVARFMRTTLASEAADADVSLSFAAERAEITERGGRLGVFVDLGFSPWELTVLRAAAVLLDRPLADLVKSGLLDVGGLGLDLADCDGEPAADRAELLPFPLRALAHEENAGNKTGLACAALDLFAEGLWLYDSADEGPWRERWSAQLQVVPVFPRTQGEAREKLRQWLGAWVREDGHAYTQEKDFLVEGFELALAAKWRELYDLGERARAALRS